MIPGPLEHLKANAIAVVVGAVLVLVVQALSRSEGDASSPCFWDRWKTD